MERRARDYSGMGTARFADVVEQCGEPESHLILIEPAKDRELQAAIKAKRVMTVFQDTVGSKADRGVVGFELGPARQFLIFPKSLRAFEGKQIIGIKYELWSAKEPSKAERAGPVKKPEKKKPQPAATKLPPNVFAFPSMRDEEDAADRDGASEKVQLKAKAEPKRKPQAEAKVRETKAPAKVKSKAEAKTGPRGGAKTRSKVEESQAEEKVSAASDEDDAKAEVTKMKEHVRAAMDALEQGKQIAAFNILKRIVED